MLGSHFIYSTHLIPRQHNRNTYTHTAQSMDNSLRQFNPKFGLLLVRDNFRNLLGMRFARPNEKSYTYRHPCNQDDKYYMIGYHTTSSGYVYTVKESR